MIDNVWEKDKQNKMAASENTRFPPVSQEFLEALLETSVPEKTKTATKYGMKIFNGMKRNRNNIL